MRRRLLIAVCAVLVTGTTAAAQDASKGWIDVNFGAATSAGDEYESAFARTMFGETAAFAAAYSIPRGASFDVGGGYMFHPRVGLGVSLSGTAHEDTAGLAIIIPHPNAFNAHALDATDTSGTLERAEGAFHIQAMFVVVESPRVRLRAFAGPSRFGIEQDVVSSIGYDQVYQIFGTGNSVDISVL